MSWTVTKHGWCETSIYGADGKRLFLMSLEDWGVDEDNQDALEKQQADIARLASLAPAMLEAIRWLLSANADGRNVDAYLDAADNARKLRDLADGRE